MRRSSPFAVLLLAAIPLGCFQPVTDPTGSASPSSSEWGLSLDPVAPLDSCPQVVELRIVPPQGGAKGARVPGQIALVEGTVSAVSLGKYQDGEVTEALLERIVPSRILEGDQVVRVRPEGILAIGQTYSVISDEGLLGTLRVRPASDPTYWARLWPPSESLYFAEQVLYCGGGAAPSDDGTALFPPPASAQVRSGLDDDGLLDEHCLRIVPKAEVRGPWLPPVRLGGVAFEPTPVQGGDVLPPVAAAECAEDESVFGPGCLKFNEEGAVLRGPQTTTMWVLSTSAGVHFEVLQPSAKSVLPGLAKLSGETLFARVFDLAGRSTSCKSTITPLVPDGHVVINEVMANPLGPEPMEEWVELFNAGRASASLEGYRLADGGGTVDLPAIVLEPGAYVVLAKEGYVGGLGGDVAPTAGVAVVRLPVLAKNGLANGGESLTLLDATGGVRSQFPARESSRAGVSLARVSPWVLDDDASGFVSHATPGASPGGPNVSE